MKKSRIKTTHLPSKENKKELSRLSALNCRQQSTSMWTQKAGPHLCAASPHGVLTVDTYAILNLQRDDKRRALFALQQCIASLMLWQMPNTSNLRKAGFILAYGLRYSPPEQGSHGSTPGKQLSTLHPRSETEMGAPTQTAFSFLTLSLTLACAVMPCYI